MKLISITTIQALQLFELEERTDSRGYLAEVFRSEWFRDPNNPRAFVQENQVFSAATGTIRGLHFQRPPAAQAKLVRCIRGAIFDVVVDLRKDSPTWRHWSAAELSEKNMRQLFIPVGFAHGYCTLEPNSIVLYKVNAPYAPELEGGIRWNDPELKIAWPTSAPVLSEKDSNLPFFSSIQPGVAG